MQEPYKIYAAHRPRVGAPITYKGEPAGVVRRVEENICTVAAGDEVTTFIWAFRDGLNKLHDWPTKSGVVAEESER